MIKILLDNGHGVNTIGKMSPDGRLKEYAYTREIVRRVEELLKFKGYDVEKVTPEYIDVSIIERIRRVNEVCLKYGPSNVILISIHNNAAGNDCQWHNAQGFISIVSKNSSSRSKLLASKLWEKAISLGMQGNRFVPPLKYIEQNIAICRDTLCPAVLTECLFQDNKDDVDYLLSEAGKMDITTLHVEAIQHYLKEAHE